MAHKEVPVEFLEFGMFVAKLDRPWTETPFVFQGFVLKTEEQLETLKKYCKKVYVDPEKRQESVAVKHLTLPPSTRQVIAEQSREVVRGSVVYKELATVEDELPRARTVFAQTNNIVQTMSRTVVSGSALDGGRARQAVAEITDSVIRNPDAMMLLVTMREMAQETLNRSTQVSVYTQATPRRNAAAAAGRPGAAGSATCGSAAKRPSRSRCARRTARTRWCSSRRAAPRRRRP